MSNSQPSNERRSPFKSRPLANQRRLCEHEFNSSDFSCLLPASYLNRQQLKVPLLDSDFLGHELNIDRLENPFVRKWFWVVGRRSLPRPLHYQVLLKRAIVVTEQLDLHLVWGMGSLYLKPIPRFLLEPDVWKQYISCSDCHCYKQSKEAFNRCRNNVIRHHALGFLFSYISLLRHESDFTLAKQSCLIPQEMGWPEWQQLVEEILSSGEESSLAERWKYGELRLSRLNKIYWFMDGRLPRAYLPTWDQYGNFWVDNIAWLAPTTVYVVVALTAMQVGLATDALKEDGNFQAVSFGLAVFSLIAMPACLALLALYFGVVFVQNAAWARKH